MTEQPPAAGGPVRLPSVGVFETLRVVANALQAAGARFFIAGSLASSLQGIPRSTQDVDLVADLTLSQVDDFVARLGAEFYAEPERIRDGISRRTSFNVIDLRNGFKADVFLIGTDAFSREQLDRSQAVEVEDGWTLPFASPEDVILQELRWYRLGGEVSERQWLDALGVLKVQGPRLDGVYLARSAKSLAIDDLLARALAAVV